MIEEDVLPRELTSPIARRGKWTAEEERYTEKIIFDFEHGTLDVPEGTTLRTLLSKVLNCDPMRITKKYTGNSSIGKRTFVPLVRNAENSIFMDLSQQELRELRAVWVNKLILMEQWNNRKMNLMKAHMGLGGPYDSNGGSHNGFGNGPPSGMTFGPNPAFIMQQQQQHQQQQQQRHSADRMGQGQGHFNPSNVPSGSGAGPSDPTLGMENFQEVSLRLILEPLVATTAEMDYIIKWLKTLNHVLVNYTLTPADLEHSLATRSISLPALVAIYRSGCVAEHPRLQQVHKTIQVYIASLGITFPASQVVSETVIKAAPLENVGAGMNTTTSGSSVSASSATPLCIPVQTPAGEPTKTSLPLAVPSDDKNSAAVEVGGEKGLIVLPPVSRALALATTTNPENKDHKDQTKDSPVSKSQLLLSAADTKPERAAPVEQKHQSHYAQSGVPTIVPIVPKLSSTDHLALRGGGAGSESSDMATESDNKPTPPVSGLFGAKYNLMPYTPEPGSAALMHAERQALVFAEQQARAHAAAQAQAQALAASYQNPRSSKLDPTILSGGSLSTAESARAALEESDDHLMHYHKALVQSLAAERSLKKTAAAAAKTHSAALIGGGGGGGGGGYAGNKHSRQPTTGAGTTSGVPSQLTSATATQPQKRRKLAEYTDMYMRAAYPQQFLPLAGYPLPPASQMGSSGNFDNNSMHTLANVAASGEDGGGGHVNPPYPFYGRGNDGYPMGGGGNGNNNSGGGGSDYATQQAMYARLAASGGYLMPPTGTDTAASLYPGMMGRSTSGNTAGAGNAGEAGSGGNSSKTGKNGNSGGEDHSAQMLAAMSQAYDQQQRRSTAPSLPPYPPQFPPEILALYMQQMYGAWPYGVPNNINTPNVQQLQQAQMLHFAESLHNAAMASAARQSAAPPAPTSTTSNTHSNSNNNNHNSGLSASARAYAEMQHAQQLQTPPGPHAHAAGGGEFIASNGLGAGMGNKSALDDYLKGIRAAGGSISGGNKNLTSAGAEGNFYGGYPLHSSGGPDANHLMMMAALNADARYHHNAPFAHSSSNANTSTSTSGNAQAYLNSLPAGYSSSLTQDHRPQGQNQSLVQGMSGLVSDANNVRMQQLMQASSAANPSHTVSTTGTADSAAGDQADREGKEKGHSAAAEALLTLLKK